MKTSYFLHYYWYKYNTGMADSGYFWSKREFKTADEAIAVRDKLITYLQNQFMPKESFDFSQEFLDGNGHFVTHKPYITKETVTIDIID